MLVEKNGYVMREAQFFYIFMSVPPVPPVMRISIDPEYFGVR